MPAVARGPASPQRRVAAAGRDAQEQAENTRQRAEISQQQIEDAKRRIDELERVLEETAAEYGQLQEKHAELAETLAVLRRYIFGQRRERFTDDPGQGHLFDIPEIIAEPEPAAPAVPDDAAPQRSKATRTPRRTRLDHLPHIRIPHDVPESEKTCSCCGGPKTHIGDDESRELDFIPARLEVKIHVLPKYACPKCRDGVVSPPVPPKPIPGGIAGAGLVSFVITSKFADHLPLYRLEDILLRHGVFLSRSTMCDWVRNAALLLAPLAELQKILVLQSPILWTDDTSVTVLGGKLLGSSKGRFWVYIGDAEHPYSVYDFTMNWARDGPAAFLKDYRGFLQADAYGGYDGIFLGSDGGILEVACWAHAHRKFFEARSNAPREANQVLEWVRQLYDIEDRAGLHARRASGAAPTRVGADPRSDREVSGRTVPAGLAQVGVGEGDDLRTQPMGGVAALRERRSADHRQQCLGADVAAPSYWKKKLGVPGECRCGSASGGVVHDPGGSEASSPGAMGLSSGRVAAHGCGRDRSRVTAAGPLECERPRTCIAAPSRRDAA